MSIENLVAGVDRLTSSIEKRRSKKEAQAEAENQKKARLDLADSFGGTLEGQTAQGQMVSKGLAAGLIDTKDAVAKIPNFSKEEALMMLHAKAATITDPDERAVLMDQINTLSEQFNAMNERQAYYKSRGKILAKEGRLDSFGAQGSQPDPASQAFGAPTNSRSPGAQRSAPRPGSAPDTNLQVTQQGPPLADDGSVKIPYSIKLQDFSGDLREFQRSEEEANPGKWTHPGKGTDFQLDKDGKPTMNLEERRAYTRRLHTFLDQKLAEKTDLGAPGFEAYRDILAARASEIYENKGANGFLTTSTRKEGITPQELVLTEQVPMGIMFTEKITKGKNKGQTVGKGLNKDAPEVKAAAQANASANKSPWAKMKNMGKLVRPDAFVGQTPQKKEDKESRPIAADTNFYLGK